MRRKQTHHFGVVNQDLWKQQRKVWTGLCVELHWNLYTLYTYKLIVFRSITQVSAQWSVLNRLWNVLPRINPYVNEHQISVVLELNSCYVRMWFDDDNNNRHSVVYRKPHAISVKQINSLAFVKGMTCICTTSKRAYEDYWMLSYLCFSLNFRC